MVIATEVAAGPGGQALIAALGDHRDSPVLAWLGRSGTGYRIDHIFVTASTRPRSGAAATSRLPGARASPTTLP